MDLRRAKFILVVAFALLDALLAWRLTASAPAAPLPAQAVPRTTSLVAAGIDLPAGHALPAAAPALPLLTVVLERPRGGRLVRALFGSTPVTESRFPSTGPTQAEIYQTPTERLSVLQFGFVQYQRLRPPAVAGQVAAATARAQAARFVQRIGGLPPGGRFDFAAPVPASGLYGVHYVEVANGLPLFPGYLEVDVDRLGVVNAQRYWLRVIPLTTPARPLLSARRALLRLAAEVDASPAHPLHVTSVDLGYDNTNYEQAKQWQLFPVWRVRMAGGVYYVNGYTGKLEE